MQPRTLAIVITLLPLLAINGAYLMSSINGHVAWCFPYIHGCTTISQAGRSGDTIFMFRAVMMVQAVLLTWFWLIIRDWISLLRNKPSQAANIICGIGVTGALFLILYIDFLGTEGEMNRFMRRYGIVIHFTFTPLAQLLLLNQLFKLKDTVTVISKNTWVLNYQLTLLLMILLIGIISLVLNYAGLKTYESENIVEWNFALLMTIYFAGYIVLWENLGTQLYTKNK